MSSPENEPAAAASGQALTIACPVPAADVEARIEERIRACVAEDGEDLLRYLRGPALRLARDLADVAMNMALLAMARKMRRHQEITEPRAYLFRAARNAAIDLLTEKYRKMEIADQEVVARSEDVVDLIPEADLALDLHQAITELPGQQRRVIECRYLRELSIAETAEVLRIAPGTVSSTASAAIQNLRGIMKRDGGTGDGDIR